MVTLATLQQLCGCSCAISMKPMRIWARLKTRSPDLQWNSGRSQEYLKLLDGVHQAYRPHWEDLNPPYRDVGRVDSVSEWPFQVGHSDIDCWLQSHLKGTAALLRSPILKRCHSKFAQDFVGLVGEIDRQQVLSRYYLYELRGVVHLKTCLYELGTDCKAAKECIYIYNSKSDSL